MRVFSHVREGLHPPGGGQLVVVVGQRVGDQHRQADCDSQSHRQARQPKAAAPTQGRGPVDAHSPPRPGPAQPDEAPCAAPHHERAGDGQELGHAIGGQPRAEDRKHEQRRSDHE